MSDKGSPAALAYLESLKAYWDDENRGPTPPVPPNDAVRREVAAVTAKALASLLQMQDTGEVSLDPAIKYRAAASELITKQHKQ